jgi:predicted XRE-type DNA-binding protein
MSVWSMHIVMIGVNNMGFPSEKKLKQIRSRLEKIEPSRTLPENATKVERVKYKICEKFVEYLLEKKVSQADLARKLNLDPARLNEIVKYRIEFFTIDKLLELAERLDPKIDIRVA